MCKSEILGFNSPLNYSQILLTLISIVSENMEKFEKQV